MKCLEWMMNVWQRLFGRGERQPSLFLRLLGGQLLVAAVIWLCAFAYGLAMLVYPSSSFDEELQEFAFGVAMVAGGDIGRPDAMANDMVELEKFYVQIGGIKHADHIKGYALAYQVYDMQGRLLLQSGDMPVSTGKFFRGKGLPDNDGDHFSECYTLDDAASGKSWRVFATQVASKQVMVRVGELSSLRWRRALDMLYWISILLGMAYALLAILIWFSTRRILKPVMELARLMSSRSRGSLEPVVVPVVFKETAPVLNELNTLLAGARQQLQEERGFLADAAHELRTPLAAVGMQAHALILAGTEGRRQSALSELNAGLKRVSHLAQQLLTLARVEARFQSDVFTQEDWVALAQERIALLTPLAMQKSIELVMEAPEALSAGMDRFGIASVIDNLVGNAIRYTPVGGHVTIKLELCPDGICFMVSDSGPGIPESEYDKVTQRFYRAVRDDEEPGSGLGLSIVQRVVKRHCGQLIFGPGRDGVGLCVKVILPQDAPALVK